jgi:hypothetical protein
MSNMSDPVAKLPKHHYIPVFYLKQWQGPDRRVIEFSRPYKDKVKPRNVHPDGTGYVRGLYRMPGVADEHAEVIEKSFFAKVDDQAAVGLRKLLKTELNDWSLELREFWTLFVLSMLMRTPETVADVFSSITNNLPEDWARAQKQWEIDHPGEGPLGDYNSTIAKQYSLIALRRFIANDAIGQLILNMVSGTMDLSKTPYRLVTSDRPIVMTNGLGYADSHLAMPLSPTMLFVAANTQQTMDSLRSMNPHDIVYVCNKTTVRRAVKYVWAQDQTHDALITSEMSKDANDPSLFSGERGPIAGKVLVPLARRIAAQDEDAGANSIEQLIAGD